MGYVDQEPIYKDVCVQTERKIVGWREAEWGGADEALNDAIEDARADNIMSLDAYLAAQPQVTINTPPGAQPPGMPVAPVDIPSSMFLMLGAIALFWGLRSFPLFRKK